MLLNAAKCQGYSLCRFWVINGNPQRVGGEGLKLPLPPRLGSITGGSESGKTNASLKLIKNQPDVYKIYLYAKDPYEVRYQYSKMKRWA